MMTKAYAKFTVIGMAIDPIHVGTGVPGSAGWTCLSFGIR